MKLVPRAVEINKAVVLVRSAFENAKPPITTREQVTAEVRHTLIAALTYPLRMSFLRIFRQDPVYYAEIIADVIDHWVFPTV